MSEPAYDRYHFADIPLNALTVDGFGSVHSGAEGNLSVLSGTNGTGIELCHLQPTAEGTDVTAHSLLTLEGTVQRLDSVLEEAVQSMKNGVTPAVPHTHLGLLNDAVRHLKFREAMKTNKDHQLWKAFRSYRDVTTLESQNQAKSNGMLIRQLKRLAPAKLNLPEYRMEVERLAEGIRRHSYDFDEQELKQLLSWVERENSSSDFAYIPYDAHTDDKFSCYWVTEHDMSFTTGGRGSVFCRMQRHKGSKGSESISFISNLSEVDTKKVVDSVYKQQMEADTPVVPDLDLLVNAQTDLDSRITRKIHKQKLVRGVFRLYFKVTDLEGQGKADTNKATIKQLKELAGPEFSVEYQTELQNLAEAIQRYGVKLDEDGMRQLMVWIERVAQVKTSRRRLV